METPTPEIMIPDSDLFNDTARPNTNISYNWRYDEELERLLIADTVYISIIMSIEVPLICLALWAICVHIKTNQSAPVFIINLLISDLIQIVAFVPLCLSSLWIYAMMFFFWAYYVGMYFMMCIAIERYVLIAHPVWHRNHRWVKCFVCSSLTGWILPIITIYMVPFLSLLMPFIFYIVIFVCFVCSCRSLSHSVSLTPVKKQLVLATLFFVLMSYTFLILPIPIIMLTKRLFPFLIKLYQHCLNFYMLNPLVDCLLYVFMRSDAENLLKTPHCCSRMKRNQTEMTHTTTTEAQTDNV